MCFYALTLKIAFPNSWVHSSFRKWYTIHVMDIANMAHNFVKIFKRIHKYPRRISKLIFVHFFLLQVFFKLYIFSCWSSSSDELNNAGIAQRNQSSHFDPFIPFKMHHILIWFSRRKNTPANAMCTFFLHQN